MFPSLLPFQMKGQSARRRHKEQQEEEDERANPFIMGNSFITFKLNSYVTRCGGINLHVLRIKSLGCCHHQHPHPEHIHHRNTQVGQFNGNWSQQAASVGTFDCKHLLLKSTVTTIANRTLKDSLAKTIIKVYLPLQHVTEFGGCTTTNTCTRVVVIHSFCTD